MQDYRALAVIIERLGSSLAHALASPLTLIRGRAELLAACDDPKGDAARAARQLQAQVDAIVELLRRVEEFGRLVGSDGEPTELSQELARVRALAGRASERGVELAIEAATAEAGVLPDRLLSAIVSAVLAYLEHKTLRGSIAISRWRPDEIPLEYASVALTLEDGVELPSGRRALYDPWLEEDASDAPARLQLALALSLAQQAGGWYERSPAADAAPALRVFIPIRS